MNKMKCDVIVAGAGAAGLMTATKLNNGGIKISVR
jgi:ribulose 1,5-bisphosphate synthetase/thiazole synthase